MHDIKQADAWCSVCGEYAMVDIYIIQKYDPDNGEIVEGQESCFMCRGLMTLIEPKQIFKAIDP
jgi:hypothetical protein